MHNRFTFSAHTSPTAGPYASITLPVEPSTAVVKTINLPVFNEQFGVPFATNGVARMQLAASQPGSIIFNCTIAGTIP